MDNTRTILLPTNPEVIEKTKKTRVVVHTNRWFQCPVETQLDELRSKRMSSFIKAKLSGYKSQDIKKGLFDEAKFIDVDATMNLIEACGAKCFYCREPVVLLYEQVREPKQWTLDRIDNSFGHNADNVEVSCLSCNLRRKTMYHERYVFTKQLTIVKRDC